MIKQYYYIDLAVTAVLLEQDTTEQQRKRRCKGFIMHLLERKIEEVQGING
jgi:hypothetical protein